MRPTFDSPAHAIAVFDGIHRALAGTADLKQIKALRDQAEAVRRYATTAALGLEMQNRAMEMRLAVERRAGEVLRDMQLRGGDRKSGRQDDTRLEGLGITKEESFRWQREASLPETDFREYLRVAKENGKKLTSRGLLDLARVHARDILAKHDAATGGRKFNALLATASINDAIEYYRIFKAALAEKQQADSEFVPLNIAAVFSPPAERQRQRQADPGRPAPGAGRQQAQPGREEEVA